ncbi:HPP family protein [Haloferax sp. DFSO60]|uniref:HPP family protein n=1 Tax=Haloferax sp. DFSO60 TaxID=3388652 RepID=UPI0039793FD4
MSRRGVETGVVAGGLFAVLGVLAWATGQPFIFPSLGPSAFVLAFETQREKVRPRRVIGGHLIGALAGFVAYSVLASGVSLTAVPPALSIEGLRLVLSGIVSVAVTGWGMLATDTVHPPACATTLIVSLGLLSSVAEVGVIVVSVGVLVAVSELLR